MAWMAIASAAMPIIGGLIGRAASEGDRADAKAAIDDGIRQLTSLGAPPDLSKKIIYEQLEKQGILTPELEEDIELSANRYEDIKEDTTLRDAQTGALMDIQQRGRVGLSPEDRAALAEIRQQTAQDAEAKRQQILQSMAQRGMAGSGAELASQMMAAQSGANRQSQEGMQLSGMASQRALQALSQSAGLASDIRRQDLVLPEMQARAASDIDRFNVSNQRDVQQRNVSSKNVAQEKNLSEAQRIADYNAQLENQERLRQAEAQRTYWLDSMDRARTIYNMQRDKSAMHQQQADNTQSMYSKMGSSAGSGLSSLGGGGQTTDTTGGGGGGSTANANSKFPARTM